MTLTVRDTMPPLNENSASALANSEIDRLCELVDAVGHPLKPKPRIFADMRYLQTSPARGLVRCFRAAFLAARTDAQRGQVVDAITRFALELIATARGWLGSMLVTWGEVIIEAQRADSAEDIAESTFLSEPTPANAQRWIDAIFASHRVDERLVDFLRTIVHGTQRVSRPGLYVVAQ